MTSSGIMSFSRLLARSTYEYNKHSSSQSTTLAVGICCGVFAIVLFTTIWIHRHQKGHQKVQQDPEALRAERRRVNGGWWGQEQSRETALERRARMAREARDSRGWEGGVEREARREREAREGEPAPPMYQLPAPTYPSTQEARRQWLMASRNQPLSNLPVPPIYDSPPADDSPAVWPVRS